VASKAVGVGELFIPTEPDGSVRVHFARPDPARFISAADVLAGKIDPQQLERKLVLIGVTALGLSDYQATPVVDRMPGVEIHAQLLENIFDADLLSRPRAVAWAEAGALLVGGLVLIWLMPRSSPAISVAVYLAMVAGIVAAGALLYGKGGMLFDAASPSLALGVMFTAMLVVTLAETEGQRQSLRRQVEQQREQAARLAGELEAARRIQMGSLPDATAAFPGDTAARSLRASRARARGGRRPLRLLRARPRPSVLPDRRRLGQGIAGKPLHGREQGPLQERRTAGGRSGRRDHARSARRDLAGQRRRALRDDAGGSPELPDRASRILQRRPRAALRAAQRRPSAGQAHGGRRPAALRHRALSLRREQRAVWTRETRCAW
jgi:hypothetical protein